MSRRFSRFIAAAVVAASGLSLMTTAFDAEARRAGGGFSMGRQSSNVMQQRRAVTPPAAATGAATAQRSAAATGAAAAGAGAARSGMSKWLGPIAGIAAGLGIAALLSHLGLGGAFLEMLSSMVLIGLLVFAALFILRRLRGGAARPAMQGAAGAASPSSSQQPMWRDSLQPAAAPVQAAVSPAPEAAEPMREGDWTIPAGFDSAAFLNEAKKQFVQIQKIWDSGDLTPMRDYLTDDLITEMQQQLQSRTDTDRTEVVLLNAELLGIEKVLDGHLASVRFSGMLREGAGEAFRFEEVWNLLKPESGGWLLAGIQQIPQENAN